MRSTAPADDVLELLIQLFLLGESVSQAEADSFLRPEDQELLREFGLLAEPEPGRVAATVALYPAGPVFVISDKNQATVEEELAASPRVFAAITPQTEEFLATLPATACPAFLEMCAGAGAAALLAASEYAVQAYAFDISERSSHFAEFSRRLNGLENVTVGRGDLYAPAGRQTFDRIVAHPPYVPSLRSEQLYRDGGEDGEALTRRLVEGLPGYLHPGGTFYCLCLMTQREGDPVERRIRGWLRERESAFDVAVIVRRSFDPGRLIFDNWSLRYAQADDLVRWRTLLKQRRIEAFVHVSMVVRRRTEERAARTVVRKAGKGLRPEDVETWLRWEWGSREVERVRVGVASEVKRRREEALTGDGWAPGADWVYTGEGPLRSEWRGPEWVAGLLEAADGSRTVEELFERVDGPDFGEFCGVAGELISEGLLVVRE